MGRLFGRFRRLVARSTDVRVRLISETITGILLVKALSWEESFSKFVGEARA